MPNALAHFAIEADDVERARGFYEQVFGWRFTPWGPPEFYEIDGAGIHGALQKRSAARLDGLGPLQLSFAVTDLAETMHMIGAAGGTCDAEVHSIPTVGKLNRFADTEGNSAMIIEYEADRLRALGLGD
jgi:predicted enzyme related to lactoylglutathione lyase